MITSLTLRNFRGFYDTTIPLSQVTMLTGINGIGKTSVLEGLYCLFSETQLDVSPLVRYNRTLGIMFNQFNGIQNIVGRQTYNYRLFWDECPMFNEHSCYVSAKSDNGMTWQWSYTKAKITNLDTNILRDASLMGINIDSSTDVALFEWLIKGITFDKKNHHKNVNNIKRKTAQILNPDGGLYLIPPTSHITSICRYLDFASIRAMPLELPYQIAKKLTDALKIINPKIIDVRISKLENGLSVILDNDIEVTLGTIGNGAVTWASTLIAIFELLEQFRKIQQSNLPIFILIDEIGAGIHYSVMLDIWKYLRDFIEKFPNIQFIMTSHNDDCIRTFCETFIETKNIVNIVRLHKTHNYEIATTQYNTSQFNNIISGEWEVRG